MSFNPGQDGFGFNNETKSDTPSYQAPTFFKPNPTNEQQPQKPTFFNPSNIQNQSQEERKPMFFNPHGEEKNTTPTKQGPPPLMNTDSPSFFQPVTKSVAPPPLQGSFFKPTTTSSPVPTTQPSFNSTPTFTQPVDTLRQPENQELLVNRDKIDPQAIPSPGLHQYPECYKKQTYGTLSQNPPPNSNLRYSVVDEGICNPRFMRASTFHFPNSDALVKKTKMLVGVNIAPFSDLDPQDMPSIVPQVVHQGGPLRCARCRAYLNAFSQMQSTSRGYTCNFCSFVNDLPDWYQYEERDKIELKVGSVDFVATKEYCAKPPLPLSYIFVVDTNAPIQTIFSIIKSQNLNNENGFGIITFNKTLQFYSFGTNPQISIVGDVDDAFVPIPLNKLVIPGGKFSSYLEQVEKLVVEESGCCFGIALDVAREILSGGGRIVSFCAHLPDVGKGKVIPRDDKSYGTRNERDLFGPQEGFWKTLADACAKQQVSVDMFLFNNKFIEAATLGYVTTKTCGSLFLYRNDMSALRGDLTRVLTRDVVFDAVLKVRCSTGLSIKQYHGSFYQQTNDDIDLPGIDSDSNWFVELKHDAEIVSQVYLQCAVLYTSKAGQRLIRVHTAKYTVVNSAPAVYRFADLDVHLGAVARLAGNLVIKNRDSMDIVKRFITEQAISILAMYRKECSKTQNNGQLVLPDSFKLLPVYFLGLMKCGAFRPGVDISIDERMVQLHRLEKISMEEIIRISYPVLFNLVGIPEKLSDGYCLPPPLSLTSAKVTQDGMYLLNDTRNTYLWIGKRCPQEHVSALFKVPFDDIKSDADFAPDQSEYSTRIIEILKELKTTRVIVCKAGLSTESAFYAKLIEDRTLSGTQSYVEFLCGLHKEIQSRLYG